MSEHASVWIATGDRAHYPALSTIEEVDVAVVGGGIAGVTTAALLTSAGLTVALVEADRIGSGTTGYTTGKVTSQHGLSYQQLIERHGHDRARLYADANQSAIDLVATLCGAIELDAEFTWAPAYVYTAQQDHRAALEAEFEAATSLGLPAALVSETDLPFDVELALRFDRQAHFHAHRYVAALAALIDGGRSRVFEQSRVVEVAERADQVVVRTAAGELHAQHAVLATLLPFVDRGGFFAKALASRSYGIAARIRGEAPPGMYLSAEQPVRSLRPWRAGNGADKGIIVVGEDHPTGKGESTPARWGALEQWARERFDVASFDYRWSAQDYETADLMPYVGRSPRMKHTYVATGFRKWGLTGATAAAIVLANVVRGVRHPWFEAFDATRIGDAETVKNLLTQNLHVGKEFVTGGLERLGAPSVAHLGRGEGGVVRVNGDTYGAYRAANGTVRAVSLSCTHLGCSLRWNAAEHSWDCPCHGSRFDTDGAVLDGPAVEPLESVKLDGD